MTPSYDAIIIGSGHNGLTCACHLARAGLRVLVVEQHYQIGGMTRSEQVTLPGFLHDVHAAGIQLGNLSPSIKELELAKRGFELIRLPVNYAHVFPDGRHLRFCRELDDSCDSIAQFSSKDAASWRQVMSDYRANKRQLLQMLYNPPIRAPIAPEQRGTLRSWLDQTFESEEVKTAFAAWGMHPGFAPDDEGGVAASAFGSVIQDVGNNPVKGGMQNFIGALASFLSQHGGEIRTRAKVDKIIVAHGRASGVRLSSGEEIHAARLVASNANPLHTTLDLLTEQDIGADAAAKMRKLDLGFAQMTIFLALDRPVEFAAGPLARQTLYVHATEPSVDFFATLAQQVRAGLLPEKPMLLFVNDGMVDPSRVPPGKASLRILVMMLPYQINGDATGIIPFRSWEDAREPYADYAIDLAERYYLPGLKQRILKRVVHDPVTMSIDSPDAVGGNVGHLANSPEQSGALRPIAELGQYRTPVGNVYLCGSGSHPGGGVTMAPGRNAAMVICDDLRLPFLP